MLQSISERRNHKYANASKINDGAAALVLASGEATRRMGVQPIARIVAYGSVAQDPDWFTTAPTAAIQKVPTRAGLKATDIHRWEINEAFAVVAMAAIAKLKLDADTVKVRCGAVALGHPIGCSGARIVTTLLHTLIAEWQRYGCAAICIGGGEATSLVVENLTV